MYAQRTCIQVHEGEDVDGFLHTQAFIRTALCTLLIELELFQYSAKATIKEARREGQQLL